MLYEQGNFNLKIFFRYIYIIIFVLGYLILNYPVESCINVSM